jgi:hypothetical protein
MAHDHSAALQLTVAIELLSNFRDEIEAAGHRQVRGLISIPSIDSCINDKSEHSQSRSNPTEPTNSHRALQTSYPVSTSSEASLLPAPERPARAYPLAGFNAQEASSKDLPTLDLVPARDAEILEDPRRWNFIRRALTVLALALGTATVISYSTSYNAGLETYQSKIGLDETLNVPHSIGLLGMTTYLLGLGVGTLLLAPLSELYGRGPCYVVAMSLFTIFIIPCALAQNIETILICRFLGAVAGSVMVANAPGTISDITTPEERPTWVSIWSIGPMVSNIASGSSSASLFR